MSQSVFEQSLSQPGVRVRSRHDAGLAGKSADRTGDEGEGTKGNHGWGDIKDATADTVIEQIVICPHQKTRRYEAVFTLANREADYRTAGEFFEGLAHGG